MFVRVRNDPETPKVRRALFVQHPTWVTSSESGLLGPGKMMEIKMGLALPLLAPPDWSHLDRGKLCNWSDSGSAQPRRRWISPFPSSRRK